MSLSLKSVSVSTYSTPFSRGPFGIREGIESQHAHAEPLEDLCGDASDLSGADDAERFCRGGRIPPDH